MSPAGSSSSSSGSGAGSGVSVQSSAAGSGGSLRRGRSGPRLRARISVRADDEPVLARCLFTTSCRCRSRRRLVHQPPTPFPSVRAGACRPFQKAAKSWPSENCVDSITARNMTVRMTMIAPIRLK